MKYNSEKHQRRSIILPGYDYSKSGAYYITICSRDRECLLGEILESEEAVRTDVGAELASAHSIRQLGVACEYSEAGRIIDQNWQDLSERFEEVSTDEYIIMPNHFHGIIAKRAEASSAPTSPTVGRIIQAFKSKCVIAYIKYIKKKNLNKTGKIWQKNYYEHIIRNESELEKIREYIINNPFTWAEDEENPININKQKPTNSTGLVLRRSI